MNILKNYFKEHPGILAVYLFGSQVRGTARKDSDIDIGILFDFGLSREERLDKIISFSGELAGIINVDIVDMNSADYPILFEIFDSGMLLIENDHDRRVQFQALKMSQYMDYRYYENRMQDAVLEKAKRI